jgi:hypothetical protein
MRRSIAIKILSIVLNLVICLSGAYIALYFQEWFGSGDIAALLFWTFPLAIGLAVSGETILSLFRTKNRLLRPLLISLTAGLSAYGSMYLLYLFLGPWMNAFSLPVFYLWLAAAFGQLFFLDLLLPDMLEKRKPIRTGLGIAAFPMTIIVTIMGIYTMSFIATDLTAHVAETFLLPVGFEGNVRVVYGEECGIEPPFENGRRILQIPSNGLLIIKPEFVAGIIDHQYYFVDNIGNREIASQHDSSKGISHGGTGSIGGAMPDGSISSESPFAIHFADIYVYNVNAKVRTDREFTLHKRRIDSLTTALVGECRKNKCKAGQSDIRYVH